MSITHRCDRCAAPIEWEHDAAGGKTWPGSWWKTDSHIGTKMEAELCEPCHKRAQRFFRAAMRPSAPARPWWRRW